LKIKGQQKHSPDGKKRGGAVAASMCGPLVMQVMLLSGINYVP